MDEAHALVVGASSEIGRAVAGELAGLGMSVTLWGRAPGRLEAAADVCAQSGQRAFADCVDVTDAADVSQTVTALSGRGPLSVVAYAAGEFDWAPADRADPAAWKRVIDVNLTAAATVTSKHGLAGLADAVFLDVRDRDVKVSPARAA